MRQSPQRDPIRAHQRRAIAARRVGENAQCACGEKRPEALVSGSTPIICASCQRRRKGQSTMDDHHVAGRANSPITIPVRANDHRAVLSPAQFEWPQDTLENPEGLETLKAAACIRGVADTYDYLANTLLRPVAERLEELAKLERQNRKRKPQCQKTKRRASYR
jgi:hypothetical protein